MSLILLGILNSQAAAAGGAGAFELLESQTLASSAASVTFTGLGSYTDYAHLQIRVSGQDTSGSNNVNNTYIKLNADTSTAYPRHGMYGNRSAGASYGSTGTTTGGLNINIITGGGESNYYTPAIIDILDFSSSNKKTNIKMLAGAYGLSEQAVGLHSVLYNKTDAVTSVEFWSASGNLDTNTRLDLYGIRGA